jgi:hypothetical protein
LRIMPMYNILLSLWEGALRTVRVWMLGQLFKQHKMQLKSYQHISVIQNQLFHIKATVINNQISVKRKKNSKLPNTNAKKH